MSFEDFQEIRDRDRASGVQRVGREMREAIRSTAALPPEWATAEQRAMWSLMGDLLGDAEDAEAARDAYRKAKQENDERFQIAAAEQRERAERAEAELAALRERVRGLAFSENAQAVLFGVTGTHPEAYGGVTKDEALECAEAVLTDLRDLLDDDTTGVASGEGEVVDSCTYCASRIKQAQERRVKTEQECARLETLRPKPGDSGYSGYAQMFNDITFAPIVTHLLFSDRGRLADALWAAGYRKTEGETK